MTNMERLQELYALKAKQGLVDVRFDIDFTHKPDAEALAGELLRINEAIAKGKTSPLDFGDLRWMQAKTYETYPTLYILMRTDLKSMNPGKGMAQAAHAANQFINDCQDSFTEDDRKWIGRGGFGTTIVLAVDSEDELEELIEEARKEQFFADIIHDETYPVRDGGQVHLVPVNTCGYVFTECRNRCPVAALKGLKLHP
jgi:peptidyl-tRNA hydrolase